MPRPPRRAGFTLIELMVSIVMAVFVLGVCMDLLVTTNKTRVEAEARSQLTRDTDLVVDMLERDVAAAGLGVPRGYLCGYGNMTKDTSFTGTLETHQLRPPVRIASSDMLAFIGDLAFPNTELNGISRLLDVKGTGADDEVAFANELTTCAPSGGGTNYVCNLQANSSLEWTLAATDLCSSTQDNVRSCPWSDMKYQDDATGFMHFVVSDAAGACWWARRVDLTDSGRRFDVIDGYAGGIHFNHDWPTSGAPTIPGDAVLNSTTGGAYMTNLDRVFYSVEDADGTACSQGSGTCVLRRRQCWGWGAASTGSGNVDPALASFPGVTSTALRSVSDPLACSAPSSGTPWETVMTGIKSWSFAYYGRDRTTGVLANISPDGTLEKAAQIRAIEFNFTLERTAGGKTFTETTQRMVYLENFGGILGATAANGGCIGTEC